MGLARISSNWPTLIHRYGFRVVTKMNGYEVERSCDISNAIDNNSETFESAIIGFETLECVANERQAHLGALLLLPGHRPALGNCSLLRLEQGGIVRLIDLVCGEVRRIDVGR